MSTAEEIPGSNEGFTTTFEVARKRGQKVGNVSTAEITDATPVAPSSYISRRACQGPKDARDLCPAETKAAGDPGSIAEQQVDHLLDVNLGGGRDRWLQALDGSTDTVIDDAKAEGYQYVETAGDLDAIDSTEGGPVLGLFTPDNMVEFKPLIAATDAGRGQPDHPLRGGEPAGRRAGPGRQTEKAIDLLENGKGFFLQVEGASIDKRDHASDVCGQIGETLAFDDAVRVALEYQRGHRDTLVVVTADHAHTSQIVPSTQDTPGLYATLQTGDERPRHPRPDRAVPHPDRAPPGK